MTFLYSYFLRSCGSQTTHLALRLAYLRSTPMPHESLRIVFSSSSIKFWRKQLLKQIDLVLQTRQVRLNSGKTKILSQIEAEKHFKVRENVFLNKFVARINSRYKNGYDLDAERDFTAFAMDYGFRRKIFETGNGEKILKRLLTIAGRLQAPIASHHISDILRNWPSTRENAMRYFLLMPTTKPIFRQ